MGNSCTRNSESQVVLSENGGLYQRRNEREREQERGRWSAPNVESVDLDTLLEAPSPPAAAKRRRKKRQSLSERFHTPRRLARNGRPPRHRISSVEDNPLNRSRVHRSRTEAGYQPHRKPSLQVEDDPTPIYHSYEDPGYLAGDPIELQPFDSDCILGSPLNSPSVIHARWGEPVDDPDEENVCMDFVPNPFKLGFCVNCMKQHDVMDDGEVAEKKEYKKIARPTISKTAANALDNPSAIPIPRSSITMMMDSGRESDIDLAQLLAQRRDVLMKLDQLDLDRKRLQQQQTELKRQKSAGPLGSRANRRTAYEIRPNKFDAGANARNNLRRMSSRPPASGPIVTRGPSVMLSPQASSARGVSKSVSLGSSRLYDDGEPTGAIWL
ncbi:hypothetical protein PHYBOEH_005844 [Phytophthora boehmeriae]|uniref:Uncharacterized protein n=1 Tax=Phytophthora boehmeriae TaxID=109152 RepID=A0A8T1WNN2_9STRA|nr:hypothetical protein PHYBOEH_005844 [Phytophthora boehmeriae]